MFPIGDEDRGVSRFTPVVILLIAINVLVFVYEASLTQDALRDFVTTYGVIPLEIENGDDLFTLLTSMFVHGGWAHIFGNMLFLWIFGNNIEDRMGAVVFSLFYLASGLAASAAHILANPGATIPSVGASGAIAGVLGAYVVLYPTNRVKVLVGYWGIIALPAFMFLGIWFLTQFISGVAALSVETAQTQGIAVWAHIGGFVVGMAGGVLAHLLPQQD